MRFCHDSFINDWQLSDAYGLANVFSDEALEIYRCDVPTGQKAATKFYISALGACRPPPTSRNACAVWRRWSPAQGWASLSHHGQSPLGQISWPGIGRTVDDMQQLHGTLICWIGSRRFGRRTTTI